MASCNVLPIQYARFVCSVKYVELIDVQGNLVQLGCHLVCGLTRKGKLFDQLGASFKAQTKVRRALQSLCSRVSQSLGVYKHQCFKQHHFISLQLYSSLRILLFCRFSNVTLQFFMLRPLSILCHSTFS